MADLLDTAQPIAEVDPFSKEIKATAYFENYLFEIVRSLGGEGIDLTSSLGSASVGHIHNGTGAVATTVQRKLREICSVKDFGAKGDGVTDDTASFTSALTAAAGGLVWVPNPSVAYMISNVGVFDFAGNSLVGESKFTTILKVISGTTGSILKFTSPASGTSAYNKVKNLSIDLNDQDVIAIDLSSVSNSVVEDCFIFGGNSFATRTGTGIKFGAPLLAGAYTNVVSRCSLQYLDEGVLWASGANENHVMHTEVLNSGTAYDLAPGTTHPDKCTIYGGRVEACTLAIKEGATNCVYTAIAMENEVTAEIEFTANSNSAMFIGCSTAVTSTLFVNKSLAVSPFIMSTDLGWEITEDSASRNLKQFGNNWFGKRGASGTDGPTGSGEYSGYFREGRLVMDNNQWIVGRDSAGTGIQFLIIALANGQIQIGSTEIVQIPAGVLNLKSTTYLAIADGMTAPGAGTGVARLYVDTADGDLKVVFADGTVKTIVVDT